MWLLGKILKGADSAADVRAGVPEAILDQEMTLGEEELESLMTVEMPNQPWSAHCWTSFLWERNKPLPCLSHLIWVLCYVQPDVALNNTSPNKVTK